MIPRLQPILLTLCLLFGTVSVAWADMSCEDMPCCREMSAEIAQTEAPSPKVDATLVYPRSDLAIIKSELCDLGCYIVCNQPPGTSHAGLLTISRAGLVASLVEILPQPSLCRSDSKQTSFPPIPRERRPRLSFDQPPQLSPNPPPIS